MNHPAIIWFRRDLRLQDNPALLAALKKGPVIALYIWEQNPTEPWPLGGASRWWLHHALDALDRSLRDHGGQLIFRRGDALAVLKQLIHKTHAQAVYWNRRYEPHHMQRDQKIKAALLKAGIEARSFNGSLLYEPQDIANQSGKPYRVFTPYWRACQQRLAPRSTFAKPRSWTWHAQPLASDSLGALKLLPDQHWADGWSDIWTPGEKGAQKTLRRFLKKPAMQYPTDRDRMDLNGTSNLSAHMQFGEISPHQILHAIRRADASANPALDAFTRQLGWREFAHHVLFHHPHTSHQPMNRAFERFPWKRRPGQLRLWQQGRTGYPIVDAAMRHLWATGTMPNRARMIVASFLTKHLMIRWQEGAAWFWDTLVDANLANNTFGWQWAGGCGADAAPYFRIFNPVKQAEKFDPHGHYVRRWIPELAALPKPWLDRPWDAPASVLKNAGVVLGKTYPKPIVEHAPARDAALSAYQQLAQNKKTSTRKVTPPPIF